jgi:uncharacterized phage infection (PIP) family protein YhgE
MCSDAHLAVLCAASCCLQIQEDAADGLQAQEDAADSLQDSSLVLQHSCEELFAAAAGLQELRVTVEQLEQDASEVVRLQQRKEELAAVPQQLLQLRQEVDELQQMADDQQAMQVRLVLGLVEHSVPRFETLQADSIHVTCVELVHWT